MPTYAFLSDEWITETRRLRDEYADRLRPPTAPPVRANLIVRDAPFSEAPLDAHLDTSSGGAEMELGHLESADATVTVDYATARNVFVDGNIAAAMEGMQLGRIKVDGDAMKLMSLVSLQADPGSLELAKRVREITH